MKWTLDALKMLARNETVPGVALRDALNEIDRLQTVVARLHADAPKKLARNEDQIEIRMIGKKAFRKRIINLVAGLFEDIRADPGSSLDLSSSIEPDGD